MKRLLVHRQALGPAGGEHILAKLRAVHQGRCGIAHRCQSPQPAGERRRHLGAARLLGVGLLVGQEQPRLEVGEPRRHDQIAGREFDAEPPGLCDIGQILLGQRQYGDAREVDLLRAGERKQKIERTLEAVEIDDQLRLILGCTGTGRGCTPPAGVVF